MPRNRLLEEIERCKEMLQKRGLLYLWDENREQVLVGMSPLLGRVFGVSDDVIERRIEADRDLWI